MGSTMKLGLQRRILILVLVPTLILGTLFVVYFSAKQFRHYDVMLEERGLATAKRLADALEFGLITGNDILIQSIARDSLNEADARSVSVFDHRLKLRAQAGPDMYVPLDASEFNEQPTILPTRSSIRFRIPVGSKRIDLYPKVITQFPRIVGWVELEMSTANTRVHQYQQLLLNLFILFAGLAISSVTAFFASQGVTGPIRKMTKVVAKIREGDLEARVDNFSEREVQELGEGINAMARSLEDAYQEMQSNIDQATQDLRETLETIEIQNIELDMARREALEASRIKSEFLANMSHEIRTPLNGIIGFTKLLSKSNLTRKQEDYVGTIHSSSESLLTIINDVLDFAKIEAGKLLLDNRSMNLRDTIEDVLNMLAPQAQSKKLELVSLIYNDVPTQIISDQLRIKQVITNLVSNAIKFTPDGSVVVRAALEQNRNRQVTIKVSVTDTGIGLSKDQQKALFNAFQQADSSTAREFGGTGLGLVISKRLVEQMGGDIGLESELNEGSTFWFTLRAEIANSIQQPPAQNDLKDKKIILFEPNDILRLSLRHMLVAWDMDIVEADDLQQLPDVCDGTEGAYAAIIGLNSELNNDGETHKVVNCLEREKACRTIVLNTTNVENDINQKLIEQVASACLSKPVRQQKLYQTLVQPKAKPEVVTTIPAVLENPTLGAPRNAPRILAVDDHPANLKLIVTLLTSLGAEVTAVDSGKKALDQLEQKAFDLIFMDIQMPHMDGMETTERIRNTEPAGRRTPIVALTAHALAGERETLIQRGMDDYLTKPVDEAQLQKTIFKWTGANLEQESDGAEETENVVVQLESFDQLDIVDLVQGLKRAGGKLGLAKDMFGMLLESLTDEQTSMAKYYQDGDYKMLLEKVHRLHGATHYCGVPRLQAAAEQTETLLKQGQYKLIEDSLFVLYEEIGEVRRWADDVDWQKEFEQAVKAYAHELKSNATA